MSSKRIVIIDDSYDHIVLSKQALKTLNPEFIEFTDSRLALEFLKSNDVDLVLTDLGIPEMSGRDLIKEIRSMGCGFPILICSGEEYLGRVARDLGVQGYLKKPFSSQELLNLVAKALQLNGGTYV